jgi:hypothetical protein
MSDNLWLIWYEFKALTLEIAGAEGLTTSGGARRALAEFDECMAFAAEWDELADQRRRRREIGQLINQTFSR